jgi:hypothetical protein
MLSEYKSYSFNSTFGAITVSCHSGVDEPIYTLWLWSNEEKRSCQFAITAEDYERIKSFLHNNMNVVIRDYTETLYHLMKGG